MLYEFKTENFKCFNNITYKLYNKKDYEFNEIAIKDDLVKTSIIYGKNGSGKTNLGLAILDIALTLTDKLFLVSDYEPYLNLNSNENAKFSYKFKFNNNFVLYEYEKEYFDSITKENLFINDKLCISYDHKKSSGNINLKGAETLNTKIKEKMSYVKFAKNNTSLIENEENAIFNEFFKFVDNMLLFSSLFQNKFHGYQVSINYIGDTIVKKNKLKDFENFLRESGQDYSLISKEINGKNVIFCSFKEKEAEFFTIVSTGTRSLFLFYYWLLELDNVSFVFIDEFDAFYHYGLSKFIVEKVLEKNVQSIFTTHNTSLITNDILRPDCYFILENYEIRSFSESTDKELRQAHNLEKMYRAGSFNE